MNRLFYLLLLASAMTLPGCSKFLDKKPQTEIRTSSFWQTEDDIKAAIAGMYSGMQDVCNTNFLYWGDSRSDNFVDNPKYGNVVYCTNGLTSAIAGSDWSPLYTVIGRANDLLKNVPKVKALQPSIDPKSINYYLSEARNVRAYCYFQLVKVWGDAPMWTVPFDSIGIDPYKPRTPSNVLLDSLIIPDLLTAASLSDPTQKTVWEANLGLTYALLMDISMWRHDNNGAIGWYNKLVALKRYNLEPTATWKNLFILPQKTVENIWSIYWDWTTDGGAGISGQIGAGNTNSTHKISDVIWNYFSASANSKDIRGAQSIDLKVKAHDKTLKYYGVNLDAKGAQIYPANNQANVYFPIYRFADMMLLRAEAANNLNDQATALTLLNQVHVRAGLTAYTATNLPDSASMSNAILKERQYEFFAEGRRFFDLVRNGIVAQVMDPLIKLRKPDAQGFAADMRTVLWPVSITVLNSNPRLTQNQPYN
jgi:hypothetical protein